jgi:hypothetical protein
LSDVIVRFRIVVDVFGKGYKITVKVKLFQAV